MKDKKIEGQEDFTLKKIRYYQGSVQDYETFWNQKIAQGESETSPETKACKSHNADLNKAFEIVPVSPGDDTPTPVVPDASEEKEEKSVKKEEDKKDKDVKKDKDEKEVKKHHKKDDDDDDDDDKKKSKKDKDED